MGTGDATRPRRARLSAIGALLAGLALSLAACATGSAPAGGSSLSMGAAAVTGMSASASVAAAALTGPGAGSWGGGRMDLFYRNSRNGQLAHQLYAPGPLATWTGAESLGGGLTSQPAVASWAAGRYDVFARGTNNAIWHKAFSGGKWSAWQSLGGVASSSPAVAAWGAGRLDVFIRGTDNRLYMPAGASAATWNQAVATHLARVRAGTMRPVVAIVLPPVLMKLYPDRWATFPWPALGADANAVAPMSYWTSYTPAPRCAAGDPRYCAYQYTRDNVLLTRQYTGLPVHVIGGSGDTVTLAQVADYLRAARETAAAGGSFYDYRTTKPQFWPYLQQLAP